MSAGQRVCAALVGLEVAVLGWCAYAVARTYRAVKGKTG